MSFSEKIQIFLKTSSNWLQAIEALSYQMVISLNFWLGKCDWSTKVKLSDGDFVELLIRKMWLVNQSSI